MSSLKEVYVVQYEGEFLGFGGFSDEYPEAQMFTKRDAIKEAKKLGKGAKVIKGYGFQNEEVVYEQS